MTNPTTTTTKTKYAVAGPWDDEPDFREWRDAETGLLCRIARNMSMGFLGGYVALPRKHPLAHPRISRAREYDASRKWLGYHRIEGRFYPHGGVTWQGKLPRRPGLKARGPHYWVGFDCGHSNDHAPGYKWMLPYARPSDAHSYRTWAYVEAEVKRLARDIHRTSK